MNNLDKTMNPNELENFDSSNEVEETINPEVEVEEQEEGNDELESLKEQLAASQKENKSLKFQKAKLKDKVNAPAAAAPQAPKSADGDLSARDVMALIEGKVPQQDINDVQEYARMKGISIAEALNSNVVKTILSDNSEQRKVASASNVGPSKRSSNTVSDEQLLKNAESGKMPESADDIMRLVKAQKGLK